MVKKIVDVPDDATNVDFKYVKATALSDYVVGHQTLSVYKMPDAPERPVIELPKSLLKRIVEVKARGVLYTFLNNITKNDVLDDFMIDQGYSDASLASNKLANWFLGHVEFVPNKEPKYRYKLIGFDAVLTKNVVSGELFLMPGTNIEHQSFTHREIERLASEKGFKLSAFKEIEVEE
ncbi:hypothetical protein [Weissella cibaria]